MKERLQALTAELVAIHDEVYVLSLQKPERMEAEFREKVLMPLKAVTAMAENVEAKLAEVRS